MLNEQFALNFAVNVEVISSRKPNPNARLRSIGVAMPPPPSSDIAGKLEAMADKMQDEIDGKLRDRTTNTPKQQQQAGYARNQGEHLKRTQQALRKLAELHRDGTVPAILAGIKTKKAAHDLTRSEMSRPTGYFDVPYSLNNPHSDDPDALALWAMLEGKTDEEQRADELRRAIDALKHTNIRGYFRTPDAVIDVMLDYAKIGPADVILEPSAGDGAILGRLPEDNLTVAYEINPTLCNVLKLRGFDMRPVDFLETTAGDWRADKILMNPPFENGQDMVHVRHAFGRLKQGGRLVSVMSPGPFFRTTKDCIAFRQWIEDNGGEVVDLPEGSFKESGTNVSTKLLIIDKE